MVRDPVRPTRRRLVAWGLSLPLFAGVAGQSLAAPLEDRLTEALRAVALPYSPAELSLVRLTARSDGGIAAVVRLTWSPGQRQQSFAVDPQDENQALARLVADIETYFTALA